MLMLLISRCSCGNVGAAVLILSQTCNRCYFRSDHTDSNLNQVFSISSKGDTKKFFAVIPTLYFLELSTSPVISNSYLFLSVTTASVTRDTSLTRMIGRVAT